MYSVAHVNDWDKCSTLFNLTSMSFDLITNPGKDFYKDDPRVWNAIFDKIATDFGHMEKHGIELDGQGVVYPIILGNKGDWSYLATWFDLFNSRLFNLIGIDDPFFFSLFETQHHLLHPQVSSAHLERSYRRAPKGSKGDGSEGDLGVEGAGICHLCMCGQGVDWENLFLDFCRSMAQFCFNYSCGWFFGCVLVL